MLRLIKILKNIFRIPIRYKILGGLLLILGVSLGDRLFTIFGSYEMRNKAKKIQSITFPALEGATQLKVIVDKTKELVIVGISGEDDVDEEIIEDIQSLQKSFSSTAKKILELDSSVDSINILYVEYSNVMMKVLEQFIETGDVPMELISGKNYAGIILKRIKDYRNSKRKTMEQDLEYIKRYTARFRITLYLSGIFVLLIVIVINLVAEQAFQYELQQKDKDKERDDYLNEVFSETIKDTGGKENESS